MRDGRWKRKMKQERGVGKFWTVRNENDDARSGIKVESTTST